MTKTEGFYKINGYVYYGEYFAEDVLNESTIRFANPDRIKTNRPFKDNDMLVGFNQNHALTEPELANFKSGLDTLKKVLCSEKTVESDFPDNVEVPAEIKYLYGCLKNISELFEGKERFLKPNEIYIATGAHHSALWGELLTASAKARGAAGAVLDGYTRDTAMVLEQDFPVFCSGTWAQDSSIRTYVFDYRCDIEIGQVTIRDGDIVFGDVDGVLIIPREIAEEVIKKALVKASTEKTMRRAIENGMPVTDAFEKFGVL